MIKQTVTDVGVSYKRSMLFTDDEPEIAYCVILKPSYQHVFLTESQMDRLIELLQTAKNKIGERNMFSISDEFAKEENSGKTISFSIKDFEKNREYEIPFVVSENNDIAYFQELKSRMSNTAKSSLFSFCKFVLSSYKESE